MHRGCRICGGCDIVAGFDTLSWIRVRIFVDRSGLVGLGSGYLWAGMSFEG